MEVDWLRKEGGWMVGQEERQKPFGLCLFNQTTRLSILYFLNL
jgi:hypothetical protein